MRRSSSAPAATSRTTRSFTAPPGCPPSSARTPPSATRPVSRAASWRTERWSARARSCCSAAASGPAPCWPPAPSWERAERCPPAISRSACPPASGRSCPGRPRSGWEPPPSTTRRTAGATVPASASPIDPAPPGRPPDVAAVAVPAHAKLNLDLVVLGRRPDGHHEIRTRFQAISLHDLLIVEPAELTHLEGGVPHDLVLRAQRALAEAAG